MRQQSARIPATVCGLGAEQPQRHTVRACEPGAELERCPVVGRPAERHCHGPFSCLQGTGYHERDVAGCAAEQRLDAGR